MSDTAQLVKEKIDIAEFVRQYVQLSPAGKNLKGLCPFHKEKSPSFIVSPDRQTWHCFGCSEGGDVFSFLMKYENLEFFEALKFLAERAGVDIKQGGADQRQFSILYEINQMAKEFFRRNLEDASSPAGEAAQTYLKERGLKPETIREFELGFASQASDALGRFFMNKGYKIAEVERAGLVFKTERGTYWDRFRNRIMFPISNSLGKVVGFTGRIMPGVTAEVGKYVNSPETPIFNKSKLLFGFHKAKQSIRDMRRAVLVEGQMDFLMGWQEGVRNLIATSGTALTADHVLQVRKIADELLIAFDSDEAGLNATERAIDLAFASDLAVSVIGKPEAGLALKDPADMVHEHPGMFTTLISVKRPAMEYYFDRYLMQQFPDVQAKKRNLRIILQKLNLLVSAVEQRHWLQLLSYKSAVPEADLVKEMSQFAQPAKKDVRTPEAAKQSETPSFSRWERIAEDILTLAVAHDPLRVLLETEIRYLPSSYKEMYPTLFAHLKEAKPLEDSPYKEVINRIVLRSSLHGGATDQAQEEFGSLLSHLKREYYRERLASLSEQIKRAEFMHDESLSKQVLAEFDNISKEMNNA